MPENGRSSGIWDSKECLLSMGYQPGMMNCVRSVSMNGGERSWREQCGQICWEQFCRLRCL
jgi:hypothetical protein